MVSEAGDSPYLDRGLYRLGFDNDLVVLNP